MTEQPHTEQTYSPEAHIGRRGDQKRRWDRENRLRCTCGRLMSRGHEKCVECHKAAEAERVLLRRTLIAEMWEAGASYKAIADAVGTTAGVINWEVSTMRSLGWPLHRRGARGARLEGCHS